MILLNPANVLMVLTVCLTLFMPATGTIKNPPTAFLVVLGLSELLFLVRYAQTKRKSVLDVAVITFALFAVWEFTVKAGLAHPVLVPSPEDVFYVFVDERQLMLRSIGSSLWLLGLAVGIALALGIFLGLIVGWTPRLREALVPIANVIGPIPPLVYTPYVVAVMPSFRSASVFVIFSAVFWPIFLTMIRRVKAMDQHIIEAAQTMDVTTGGMLFRVILPYCMPGILNSLPGVMRGAFLCLTGAELLGASSGLGYFVKKFSDYANYSKVIAGIILMGIVVTLIDIFLDFLSRKCIKWNYV